MKCKSIIKTIFCKLHEISNSYRCHICIKFNLYITITLN